MKTYALMDGNVVHEVIAPCAGEDGVEVPIEQRFTADLIERMIDVTEVEPRPDQRWTFADGVFLPPGAHVQTPTEIKANNSATRNFLLDCGSRAINPLQYAVDADDATAAELALLNKWKKYCVAVNRVDLTLTSPTWPEAPA
ncbi:tail fiber assembly protein [Pseudomonas helmanticensis]|uniref:tail fiber assembly protein n=1 Tax=Pseudomonas helmanticensis TaxID=1471381 RepID=UPI0037FAAEE7